MNRNSLTFLSLAPICQIYYGWTKGMLAFLERMGDKGAKLKLSIDTMLLVPNFGSIPLFRIANCRGEPPIVGIRVWAGRRTG